MADYSMHSDRESRSKYAITNPVTSNTSFIKPVASGFDSHACVPPGGFLGGHREYCGSCGQSFPWGSNHYCMRGYMTPSDYVPELGRRLSQEPCGERHKDGPTTCTLPKGHDGKHSAPVRWDHW